MFTTLNSWCFCPLAEAFWDSQGTTVDANCLLVPLASISDSLAPSYATYYCSGLWESIHLTTNLSLFWPLQWIVGAKPAIKNALHLLLLLTSELCKNVPLSTPSIGNKWWCEYTKTFLHALWHGSNTLLSLECLLSEVTWKPSVNATKRCKR